MHKTPAKFHKDLSKIVGVVLSKYLLIVSEMPKNDFSLQVRKIEEKKQTIIWQ